VARRNYHRKPRTLPTATPEKKSEKKKKSVATMRKLLRTVGGDISRCRACMRWTSGSIYTSAKRMGERETAAEKRAH